jgi:methionine synthase II (cobalamin-independent)
VLVDGRHGAAHVEDRIETPEEVQELVEEGRYRVEVGDVMSPDDGLATGGGDLFGDLVEPLFSSTQQGDMGP